jgi:hypothetical protein
MVSFLDYISYSFYNFTSRGGGYMNKIKSRWPTHVSYHYHKIVWIWKQTRQIKEKEMQSNSLFTPAQNIKKI